MCRVPWEDFNVMGILLIFRGPGEGYGVAGPGGIQGTQVLSGASKAHKYSFFPHVCQVHHLVLTRPAVAT